MFKIDKNLVNLAVGRSVQIGSENGAAGALGLKKASDASASDALKAQDTVSRTQNAFSKAQEKLTEANAEAARVIEAARHEAASIILAARDDGKRERSLALQDGYAAGASAGRAQGIKDGLREGYGEGYDKGYADGSAECRREFDEKLQEDDKMLTHVISEFHQASVRVFDGLEEKLAALTLEIVKKIINPAGENGEYMFTSLIINALRQVELDGRLTLRVGANEYDRFFSSGSAVFDLGDGVKATASVIRDAAMSDGDCIIDTETETLNAGIDSQLKYIRLAFEKAGDK